MARGIGILLVVAGHNWLVWHDKGLLFRLIYSFHMALFFYLSGLFLKPEEGIWKVVSGRANSILKPFLVVSLVVVALTALPPGGAGKPLLPALARVAAGEGVTDTWTPLWFLPHLYLALVAATALLWLAAQEKRTAVPVAVALAVLLGATGVLLVWHPGKAPPAGLPWSLDLLPLTTAVVMAGYLTRAAARMPAWPVLQLLVSVALFVLLHTLSSATCDLHMRILDAPLVVVPEAVCGVLAVLAASSLLARWRPASAALSYIGAGSLIVLLFHSFFQGKIFAVGLRLVGSPVLAGVLAWGLSVLACLAVQEAARRQRILSALLLP